MLRLHWSLILLVGGSTFSKLSLLSHSDNAFLQIKQAEKMKHFYGNIADLESVCLLQKFLYGQNRMFQKHPSK